MQYLNIAIIDDVADSVIVIIVSAYRHFRFRLRFQLLLSLLL